MSVNRNPFAHLRCAALSDVGRKRKNNEDAAASFPRHGVWCVADGMGGGDDGEIASGAVVRAVDACLAGMPIPEEGDYSADTVVRFLARAIGDASAWISDRAVKKGLDGCGSTVVGVAFDPTYPGTALAFHVGDSRLYRLRGREIRQITKDHSVEALMGAKEGKTLNPMFRGMILRAVGIERSVEIETTKFPVQEGDVVLLCSDGLSRMLKDARIAEIVHDAEGDMGLAATRLVEAANEAGGVDNITVVLVHVGALPTASAAARPPHDGEASSTGTTGSIYTREEEERGIVPFLRRHGWRIGIVTLAALGGAVFAYFVATAPLQQPEQPPPAAQSSQVLTVKPVAVSNEPPVDIATQHNAQSGSNTPPSSGQAPVVELATNVPPDRPASTADVAKAELENVLRHAGKAPERTAAELQEERERQEALAQLKAEREQRANEEAAAAKRAEELLAGARMLAAYYYRDEFAAFARMANNVLGDGAAGRLQLLGRTLHLCKKDEAMGVAAMEFMAEAHSLAGRIAAASKDKDLKKRDAKVAKACRGLAAADPATPAAQREFLDILKMFSPQGTEDNGRAR